MKKHEAAIKTITSALEHMENELARQQEVINNLTKTLNQLKKEADIAELDDILG